MRSPNLSKFSLVLLIHCPSAGRQFRCRHRTDLSTLLFAVCRVPARHPGVRLGLHYTGPLLEWFERRHPEFFDHLRELDLSRASGTGRRRLLRTDPRFHSARGSAAANSIACANICSKNSAASRMAHGSPSASGSRRCLTRWLRQASNTRSSTTCISWPAGFELDQLHGDYVCEDRGQTVRVFPGLKSLALPAAFPSSSKRPSLSFVKAPSAIPAAWPPWATTARSSALGPAPTTIDYRDGWLDGFFEPWRIRADWLVTIPPGEYIRAHRAPGPRRPADGILLRDDGVGPAHHGAERFSQAVTPGICRRPDVIALSCAAVRGGLFSPNMPNRICLHKKMLRVSAKQLRRLIPNE